MIILPVVSGLAPAGTAAPVVGRRSRLEPVLGVRWLVPDLPRLPRARAQGTGRLRGRHDPERGEPLIGLGVTDTARGLQVRPIP